MAMIRTFTKADFELVLKVIAISGVLVIVYCLLQVLNLDQFFRSIDNNENSDVMVGMIGNTSHLGTHLALLVPVFAYQKGKFWLFMAILSAALVVITSSIGALLALGAGLCWMFWFSNRTGSILFMIAGIFALFGLLFIDKTMLNPHGRIEAWGQFWNLYSHNKPITGLGVGYIIEFSKQIEQGSSIFQWRHVHNEFFQLAIEQGLIGLSLVSWGLYDAGKKIMTLPKSKELIALSTILIILCVNSLVNFPIHLWLLGSFGLLAYSGIYVLAREELA